MMRFSVMGYNDTDANEVAMVVTPSVVMGRAEI